MTLFVAILQLIRERLLIPHHVVFVNRQSGGMYKDDMAGAVFISAKDPMKTYNVPYTAIIRDVDNAFENPTGLDYVENWVRNITTALSR